MPKQTEKEQILALAPPGFYRDVTDDEKRFLAEHGNVWGVVLNDGDTDYEPWLATEVAIRFDIIDVGDEDDPDPIVTWVIHQHVAAGGAVDPDDPFLIARLAPWGYGPKAK